MVSKPSSHSVAYLLSQPSLIAIAISSVVDPSAQRTTMDDSELGDRMSVDEEMSKEHGLWGAC